MNNKPVEFLCFESDIGCVAQSVEQWPFKPTVVGSIPSAPTLQKKSPYDWGFFYVSFPLIFSSKQFCPYRQTVGALPE